MVSNPIKTASRAVITRLRAVALVMAALTSACLAGQPQANTVDEQISRALVWNHYWYGDWEAQWRGLPGRPLTVHLKEENWAVLACIDELQSVLHLDRESLVVFGSWVPLPELSPELNSLSYAKLRHEHCESGALTRKITLRQEAFAVVEFGPFTAEDEALVKRAIEPVIDDEWMAFMTKRTGGRAIRLRVSNPSREARWIPYFVEGVPYLGQIVLNEDGSIASKDFFYLRDTPHRKRYEHAMMRLRESGRWFTIRDGRLIK